MKICSVSFSNINSLAGHFSLDFENPELTAGGMFLITGPTGSGKSTLLDAIAFALYGSTPRQGNVSATVNELMSRDFATCHSRVVFEQNGVRYAVSTEQRRKKGRTDTASPFAAMERRLEQQLPDGSWAEKANAAKTVKAALNDITGMPDINAFCRCMMLAQGEFSRFLTMPENERAALLSTITRTEEYAAIGEEAQVMLRESENALCALKAEETLSGEERAAKEALAAEQRRRKTELNEQLESHRMALQWHAEQQRRQQQFTDAQQALQNAEQARQAFRADGRESRLLAAQQAAAAEPAVLRRDRETQERRRTEKAAADTQAALTTLIPQLKAAENAHTQAEKTAAERGPQLAQLLTRLSKEIRPAEQELHALLTRQQELDKAAQRAETKLKSARRTAESAAREESNIRLRQEKLEAESNSLLPYAALPPALAGIQARQLAWAAQPAADTPLPPLSRLETERNHLQEERTALLNGREPAALREYAAVLSRLMKAQQQMESRRSELRAAEEAQRQAQECLRQLEEPLAQAERELTVLRTVERNTAELASHREILDACYRKFCAGDYPVCPCCGAATPGQHRSIGTNELEQARQMTQKAEEALQELQRKQRQTANEQARAAAALTAHADSVAALRREIQEHLQALGMDNLPTDAAALIKDAEEAARRGEKLGRELALAEQQLTCARERDALHSELRPFVTELPATAKDAAQLVKELAAKAQRLTRLTGERQTLAALAEAQAAALENARKELTAVGEEHKARTAEQEEGRRTCAARRESLHRLRGDRTADEWEQAYRAEEQALHDRLQRTSAELAEHQQRQTALSAALTTQREALAAQQQSEAEAFAKMQEVMSAHGFPDEEAYRAACLPEAARRALSEELKTAEERLLQATSAAAALQEALQRHLNTPHRTETPEELRTLSAAVAAELTAADAALTATCAELKLDDERIAANRSIAAQRAELQREHERCLLLKDILGGNKLGFQQYAQSITFDALIAAANKQLQRLFPRFILTQDRARGPLHLGVTDLWLDDTTARHVSNLSGGETFVVSLALALGLSGISNSRVSIDTLFLDEGFGTLDQDTLHTVLNALEQLHLDGKSIGIITHVESLKNSFAPAGNIRVEKLGNSGYSTLRESPGVSAAPASVEDRGTTPTRRRTKSKV